ncbi:hypothetical protein IWQ61_008939 [Dispira simplex]|nr:hypothetical protein IWQ61_008939 [Dispira simplex]
MATSYKTVQVTARLRALYSGFIESNSTHDPKDWQLISDHNNQTDPTIQECEWDDAQDDEQEVINFIPIGPVPRNVTISRSSKKQSTSSSTKAEPFLDTVLNRRYRVLSLLGEGCFGRIYLAQDLGYASICYRLVAIKVTWPEFNDISRKEYERLRWLGNLNSDDTVRIVRTYDSFVTTQDCYGFVMDALTGGHISCATVTLLARRSMGICASDKDDRLTENASESVQSTGIHKPLPMCTNSYENARLGIISKIAIQLVGAIGFLNGVGFAHADLKPENIMCVTSHSAQIRLIDFGNVVPFTEFSLYHENYEIQTFAYRAPEVIMGCEFDQAIDMWSIGCILCELFSGKMLLEPTDPAGMVSLMIDLLGPFPQYGKSIAYQEGKYHHRYPNAFDTPPWPARKRLARLSQHLGTKRADFLTFIDALLAYDPANRLTPRKALLHPFLQAICPFPIWIYSDGITRHT